MKFNSLYVFIIMLLLLIISPSIQALANQNEIVLLGNKNGPDTVKKEDIKQIFLGKKTRWADDTKIVFVLFNNKETLKTFLKTYIGKTSSQYKNYWKKQVFTGKGRMPKSFQQPNKLFTFLSEYEGAISFGKLDDVNTDLVKVIAIEQ